MQVLGRRSEYTDTGSVVGYIPDDVSSVHSSAIGGVGLPSGNFPSMFQNFDQTWPTLPGRAGVGAGKGKGSGAAASVAGESVAASDAFTDMNGSSVAGGKEGGVSLAGLSINDAKPASLSQSDRLKRYVESNGNGNERGGGFGGMQRGLGRPTIGLDDDDARSISTAFASQIGATGTYD
jgi:regulator of nonsense transcripts 1